MDDILDRLRSQIMSLKTSGHVELAAFDEIKRNRAAIDELVTWLRWSLNYVQIDARDSYQFEQATLVVTKHTQRKEQA